MFKQPCVLYEFRVLDNDAIGEDQVICSSKSTEKEGTEENSFQQELGKLFFCYMYVYTCQCMYQVMASMHKIWNYT